jgi:molybdenum cofactor guanylyltransferase
LPANAAVASVPERVYARCQPRTVAVNARPHGFVLAGGHSRRMGTDKALLLLNGQPLLLRLLNLLRPYVGSVAVLGLAGAYDFLTDPVIPDRTPGRGPLAAILTGLEHSCADWSIFLACDMPLLSSEFIELLLRFIIKSNADAIVPLSRSRWQPLCAAYHKSSIGRIREVLDEGNSAVIQALPRLRVDVITDNDLAIAHLSESIFENVNRLEEWGKIVDLTSARAR